MEILNPVILDQCGKDISDSFSKTLCSCWRKTINIDESYTVIL